MPRLWRALQTGLESNPPGFHLLTRASEKIFGENLIGTRMPEIVSFWVLCLCLYKFVERRAGALAGFVAMLLPMLTGAYFYAYEARPLIIVVALASVALLCWDNALGMGREQKGRDRRWLAAFSLALFAAYMLHCYAILLTAPFAIAELYRAVRLRRIDWGFWLALGVPLIPTFFLYLPMLRFFRAASDGTDFAVYYAAVWPEVIKFYGFLLVPCTAILLLAFALFARDRAALPDAVELDPGRPEFSWEDTLLCLGFAALPAFGVLLGQIVKSPYFGRYFLSALLGFCIPFAIMTGATKKRRWIVPVVLAAISFALVLNFARLVRHRITGSGETLIEPSTKTEMSTTAGHPLRSYPLIVRQASHSDEPIGVLEPTEFLYLLHYAPSFASRLYYIHSDDRDASLRGLRGFRPLSPVKFNPVLTDRQFAERFQNFYVYTDELHLEEFYRISRLAKIRSFAASGTHILASMQADLTAPQFADTASH